MTPSDGRRKTLLSRIPAADAECTSIWDAHSLCITPCLLGLLYGVPTCDTGEVLPYTYERMIECVAETPTLAKVTTLNFDQIFESNPRFCLRGLTPSSLTTKFMKRVNRLPFIEYWLRTGSAPWISSGLTTALEIVHLATNLSHKFAVNRRLKIMDAGCGTGFVAAVLALMGYEVLCVEYLDWVSALGQHIHKREDIFDLRGLSETHSDVFARISYVVGDAINMTTKTGRDLPKVDMVMFGMALPYDDIPASSVRVLSEGGIVIGPRCKDAEREFEDGTVYCNGEWVAFRQMSNRWESVQLGYEMPFRRYMAPW